MGDSRWIRGEPPIRLLHRAVGSGSFSDPWRAAEPTILNALTGSILFHSGVVLAMAVLVAGPGSNEGGRGSLVLAVPSAMEAVGELTLDISDDPSPFDPTAPTRNQTLLSRWPPALPDFSVEFDASAIKLSDSASTR